MKRTSNIYSTIGISLVLLLLGTIGWMFINGKALSNYFKENVLIQVIMYDQTQTGKAQQLEQILQKQPFVKNVTYISKEDAYEKYVKNKGEDPLEEGLLTENPFYISLDVKLNHAYVQSDSIAKIEKFILQSNIVKEVIYDNVIVDTLDKRLSKIGWVLGGIAIILFISVIIIIDNTVRLAMFSNRMLIKTMQMVGATRWFIAKPFNSQAFITGLFSAIIAIFGMFVIRYTMTKWIPELNALTEPWQFYILCAIILIIGVVICVYSTHRSVFKYLRMKVDKLY